jgi:ribosome-associated protein
VNIVSLNLEKIEDAVTSCFIICEGEANTHIKAIANRVEVEVKENLNDKPWHIEGLESLEWVIIDYVNVVVHVFKRETRDFYKLEDLWIDAEKTDY